MRFWDSFKHFFTPCILKFCVQHAFNCTWNKGNNNACIYLNLKCLKYHIPSEISCSLMCIECKSSAVTSCLFHQQEEHWTPSPWAPGSHFLTSAGIFARTHPRSSDRQSYFCLGCWYFRNSSWWHPACTRCHCQVGSRRAGSRGPRWRGNVQKTRFWGVADPKMKSDLVFPYVRHQCTALIALVH